jgi:hypothetical protein
MEQAMNVPQADGSTRDVRWTVDLAAAGRVATWARENPTLLAQEVAEMATYFPRWVLTVGDGQRRLPCGSCGDVLVFREGKCRCVRCGRALARRSAQLAWMGHLPVPVGGLPRTLARIQAQAHPGYPLVTVGGTPLWLVPVAAFYPADWPRSEPIVRYDSELFRILGIPYAGASHHIVDTNRMCLYAWSQWRAVTLRVVLQQRVVNHLASLLKVGDGQAPVAAFAGNQHTYGGQHDYDDRADWR